MRTILMSILAATILVGAAQAVVFEQISPAENLALLESAVWDPAGGVWSLEKSFALATVNDAPNVLVLRVQTEGAQLIPIHEVVTNNTSETWIDYHLAIVNFDGTPVDADAIFVPPVTANPFNTIDAAAASIDLYDGVVAPGETVTLDFAIETNAAAGSIFQLKQYPTVPEPATAMLLVGGLVAVLRRRTSWKPAR